MVFQEYAIIVVLMAVWFAVVHVLCRRAVSNRFKLSFGSLDHEKKVWNFLPSRKDYFKVFFIWLAAYLISGTVYLYFAKPVPFSAGIYVLLPIMVVMAAELLDPIATRSYPVTLTKVSTWPIIIICCFVSEALLINVILYVMVSFLIISQWILFMAMLVVSGTLAVAFFSYTIEQFWVMKMREKQSDMP